MSSNLSGFRGEYLWEYDYAQKQMLALAEAFPAERYCGGRQKRRAQ